MIIRRNASKTLENIFCVIVNVNFMIENEIQIERSVKIIKHHLCQKKKKKKKNVWNPSKCAYEIDEYLKSVTAKYIRWTYRHGS